MNALHNRLITLFEGITQQGRLEDFARRDIEDLHNLLLEWANATANSLLGDKEQTKKALERAFQLAMEADERKGPPPKHGGPIVRYGDLS